MLAAYGVARRLLGGSARFGISAGCRSVLAVGALAVDVKVERMLADRKAALCGDFRLALFDHRIKEFLNPATLQAD